MDRNKYEKNLEDFITELKSSSKTELLDVNKWDKEMEEIETITKKYKTHGTKKKY